MAPRARSAARSHPSHGRLAQEATALVSASGSGNRATALEEADGASPSLRRSAETAAEAERHPSPSLQPRPHLLAKVACKVVAKKGAAAAATANASAKATCNADLRRRPRRRRRRRRGSHQWQRRRTSPLLTRPSRLTRQQLLPSVQVLIRARMDGRSGHPGQRRRQAALAPVHGAGRISHESEAADWAQLRWPRWCAPYRSRCCAPAASTTQRWVKVPGTVGHCSRPANLGWARDSSYLVLLVYAAEGKWRLERARRKCSEPNFS